MVDKVEVLNRHVAGNCSGIPADSDAVAMPALCRELARLQVCLGTGRRAVDARRCRRVHREAAGCGGLAGFVPRSDAGFPASMAQVHFIWGQLSALQQFYEER